ncbi:MAG: pyridoxal-phosphate dependent enzyme [Candidatus Thorarchaeota archaeon]|nr:pyridoxal-phosphate dependent enzyme [Candidatus Thorarchaeota archaeon]
MLNVSSLLVDAIITLDDVLDAYGRVKGVAHNTPILTSRTIDQLTGAQVYFKCENFQRAGAFKFRGAYNTLSQMSAEEQKRGVITHSSGNHAQALALASSILGIKATVIMPENSARVKIEATRGYGAEVVLCEPTLEARERTTNEFIERHGYLLIHPYDNERIIAGAGTAAVELIHEVHELDVIMCPVGGGGLLSGTAIATKGLLPDTAVIAAEPENANDAYRGLKSGEWVPSVNPITIADGLRTSLGRINFPIIRKMVNDIITVSEEEIVDAMRLLWERMKLVVEPSGAVPLAGLLARKEVFSGKRIGILLSGGNIDLTDFFDLLRAKIRTI